jgi:GNAT superfamily N-acetyltransferase
MTEPALTIEETQPAPAVEGHCRMAVQADRPHFVRLWREYLTDMYERGSAVLPDEHNLYVAWDYFDAYATGRLDGGTVFWSPSPEADPVGVTMGGEEYGESIWHFDLKGERWGRHWGLYVQPEHRGNHAGRQMELFGARFLLGRGFHRLVTAVRAGNALGRASWRNWDEVRGTEVMEFVVVGRLGEQPSEPTASPTGGAG